MIKDLITFEGVLQASEELFGFSEVTLLRDFGPLKKGSHYASLWIHTEGAYIDVYEQLAQKAFVTVPFRLEAL